MCSQITTGCRGRGERRARSTVARMSGGKFGTITRGGRPVVFHFEFYTIQTSQRMNCFAVRLVANRSFKLDLVFDLIS